MEKPRIHVEAGYIIATASNTLDEFEADYEVILETNINTSIGYICIVKIKKSGNALIAGPSVVSELKKTINLLKQFGCRNILIDGAFFRHSFAKIADATVFVVGANLSHDMEKVIQDAIFTQYKFMLKKPPFEVAQAIDKSKICLIDEQLNVDYYPVDSLLENTVDLFRDENKKYRFLYFPKSLTNKFVQNLVDHRYDFDFDIVLNSPVSIQLDFASMNNVFKLENKIYVLNQIHLAAVCCNPVSPRGYEFDHLLFKQRLQEALNRKVYNVKEEEYYE
ncbi:MAG: hypothetical protein JXL85_02000 [Bacilli bacterium]|nr:hypothetical protein [Bacilli bacterium]